MPQVQGPYLTSSVRNMSIVKSDQYHQDVLEGVHVVEEKVFSIQSRSAQSLNWEEYGIRMAIPQGALVSSRPTSEVAITALVGGQFILPEDTELVSAVYHISVSKPFLEPVQLAIQHCVSIETVDHTSYLSFATAPVNQSVPYQFQLENGGQFSPGEQYGTIVLSQFSLWAVIKRLLSRRRATSTDDTGETTQYDTSVTLENVQSATCSPLVSVEVDPPPVKLYAGQMIYEVKVPGRQWLIRLFLSKDLNALLRLLEKSYKDGEKDVTVHLKFEEVNGSIELVISAEKEDFYHGWRILPHTKPLKISQDTVDRLGDLSPPNFPSCLVTIIFIPGDNAVPVLQHTVLLRGVETDNQVLNIVRQSIIDDSSKARTSSNETTVTCTQRSSTSDTATTSPVEQDPLDPGDHSCTTLENTPDFDDIMDKIPELPDLMKTLKSIRSRHASLAYNLGVDPESGNPNDDLAPLGAVLSKWRSKKRAAATWKCIIEALRVMECQDVIDNIIKLLEDRDIFQDYKNQGL